MKLPTMHVKQNFNWFIIKNVYWIFRYICDYGFQSSIDLRSNVADTYMYIQNFRCIKECTDYRGRETYFKCCPVPLIDVERSFSAEKLILCDKQKMVKLVCATVPFDFKINFCHFMTYWYIINVFFTRDSFTLLISIQGRRYRVQGSILQLNLSYTLVLCSN